MTKRLGLIILIGGILIGLMIYKNSQEDQLALQKKSINNSQPQIDKTKVNRYDQPDGTYILEGYNDEGQQYLKTYYDNDQLKTHQIMIDPVNFVEYEKKYAYDGRLLSEAEKYKGYKYGWYKSYARNGTLVKKTKYEGNIKHGPFELYYVNGGALRRSGQYNYNVAHGDFVMYHPNGEERLRVTYNDKNIDEIYVNPDLIRVWEEEGLEEFERNKDFSLIAGILYVSHEFELLEEMLKEFRDKKLRKKTGGWYIDDIYAGIHNGYEGIHAKSSGKFHEAADAWIEQFPESTAPKLIKARALVDKAWSLRGHGYSNTISVGAMERMDELLQEAESIWMEVRDSGLPYDEELYVTWMKIGLLNGYKVEEYFEILDQAIEMSPYYYGFYWNMKTRLLPRWGGSSEAMIMLAEKAADATKEQYGDYFYSYVAASYIRPEKEQMFKEHEFDWQRIKSGCQSFPEEYLVSKWHSNACAWMAIKNDDKEVALQMFELAKGQRDSTYFSNEMDFVKWQKWAANEEVVEEEVFELHQAIRVGNYEEVVSLIKAGKDINERDQNNQTPLIVALLEYNHEIAFLLINHGANYDEDDYNSISPIHYSAKHGFVYVVKLLIEKGVDPNKSLSSGPRPIHLAAKYGHLPVIRVLVEAGVDVNTVEHANFSALMYAVDGHYAITEYLLSADNININAQNEWKGTALHQAAKKGYKEICRLLLESGADPSLADIYGSTAADYARTNGYPKIQELIEQYTK